MNIQNVINNETKSAQMTLTYHRVGDYYLPDLSAPDSPRIGKFGMMRHKYLRDHHRGIFDGMLLKGTLNAHLEEIDRQANEMLDRLTRQMAAQEGVTEQLKAADQLAWVGCMNSIRNRAVEIILAELIYA